MKLKLSKKPKGATLIEGFPGFGLVGTIVTDFLIEHLKCEQIGEISLEELPPTAAIHKGELVSPLGIFYNKKYNLVILHAILNVKGYEWTLAQAVKDIVKRLEIKEVISVEGIASEGGEALFCFQNKQFEKLGAKPIDESVIMGVTAALLLQHVNNSCLFVETHSNMPDSRAAAKIIEFFDKYFKLDLDTKPLLLQAEIFEKKLKDLLQKTSKTETEAERKQMSYLG